MPKIYTDAYFDQQKRMAEAKQAITAAMYAITSARGELTTIEWIAIFNEQITRMIAHEMSEEGDNCDNQQ